MTEFSPETQRLVDDEVKRLIDGAHAEVTALLTANQDKLDALAAALLEGETLDQDDAYRAAGLAPAGEPQNGASPAPAAV